MCGPRSSGRLPTPRVRRRRTIRGRSMDGSSMLHTQENPYLRFYTLPVMRGVCGGVGSGYLTCSSVASGSRLLRLPG